MNNLLKPSGKSDKMKKKKLIIPVERLATVKVYRESTRVGYLFDHLDEVRQWHKM